MSLNLDKSAWKRVTFGDAVHNANDSVRNLDEAGIDRIIAMEHMDPGELKISRWGSTENGTTFTRRVKPGQTLFGKRRAYQRKVGYAEFDAMCSGDIYTFEADEAQMLGEFLPFLVQSNEFFDHALSTSAGSLSPRTNWRDLANFEFDLPPVDEQKRIADLLWATEWHRQAVDARSASSDRLADEVFSNVLARSTAETILLPRVVEEMTVGVVVRPTQYYTDDPAGVPALRGLNIEPGGFDLTDLVRFKPESAAELKKSTLGVGDVAIVRTGRPGDAAVVTDDIAGFNCIDLIIARPGSGLVPEFLAHYLNSSYGRGQIARLSAGTAQQHFNVGALKKLEIPHFDIDEQRQIVQQVEEVRASADLSREEAASLRTVSTALLAEIFGGN
ncbi:restriction endonuclease subunit S [Mycobacterium hackensackense]|uniref:restriction endonuclease subunit S n=1 Tax=Mycobacterium hackensackense TaxID=228909 RepID=UPI002265E5BD|nr:restriction endonuclease subunit S [Mycobacterium hackensackense]MCV7253470.1 restriction endonuclease subunit S [Mycobacterium hackensackense]